MTRGGRIVAAFGALLFIAVLAHALASGGIAGRRLYLVMLAAASVAWFTRRNAMQSLALLVPLGPIVDFFFLTPDRGIYATEVILLSALASWLTGKAYGRDREPWPKPNLPVLLFSNFGAIALLALVAGHADRFVIFDAYRMARVLLLATAVGFMFTALAGDDKRRAQTMRWWTGATLAALALLGLLGILEYLLTGRGGGHFEPGSFYRSSVGLAVHAAFFGPVALCVALGASSSRWRLGGIVSWLLMLLCLPLTASRGALGSVLITLAMAILVTIRRTRGQGWRGIAVVMLVILAGAILLMVNPELAGESFAYKYRASIEGDFFSTRVDEWRETWTAIGRNPLFGEGPEAWAPSVPLELMRRHGIPAALLALAAIFAAVFSMGRRAWRWDRDETPAMIGGLHVASLAWGVTLGLVGLFLVGLAETGLGARTTPLLAVMIAMTMVIHTGGES